MQFMDRLENQHYSIIKLKINLSQNKVPDNLIEAILVSLKSLKTALCYLHLCL